MGYVAMAFLLACGIDSYAQTASRPTVSQKAEAGARSTPAYAEIALKRTDVEAELESLLIDYTDDFPKVKELKHALTRIDAEAARLLSIKAADRDRATVALGKLMVRKVEAEIDLWKVQQDYADAHPDVKRARKKVEIFEKAIKEILG